MKILVIFLLSLFHTSHVWGKVSYANHKEHDQCDIWAKNDGECVNNPRFMWSACLGSCIENAKDVEDACLRWMKEGECENNPRYIQVHCPRSCSMALAWDPWVRRNLDISPLNDPTLVQDSILANDVISASEVMKARLQAVFQQYNDHVQGFAFTAPTHYLGLLGLAEAFLYAFRLQEVVLQSHGDADSLARHQSYIDQAVRTIEAARFQADLLSRELPFWVRFLEETSAVIQAQIVAPNPDLRVPFLEVARHFRSYTRTQSTTPEATLPVAPFPSTKKLLNNKVEMPLIGLGTWQLVGEDCLHAVKTALSAGFRALDTAQAYQNEAVVGQALQESISEGIITSRKDVFLASKVSFDEDLSYDGVQRLLTRQLRDLRTDYLDLYMLHSPPREAATEKQVWRALTEWYHAGKLRAIGVSNYDSRELQRLMKVSEDLAGELNMPVAYPTVVQNKVDIYHVGKQLDTRGDELVAFCRQHNILLVGYSAFSAYPFTMLATQDPIVLGLAQHRLGSRYTAPQLLLHWALRRGMAVLPRSQNLERLGENLRLVAGDFPQRMTAEEEEEVMAVLDTMQYLVASPVAKPISLQ